MKIMRQQLKSLMQNRNYIFLACLLLFSLVIRLIYVQGHDIPFTFDHGKDSLAVIHMLETKDVKLIGPWTSIPGLYFGPAWYYLLGVGYYLTQYDPMGGIYVMIALTLIQTYFLYKYISKTAAVISATTPFWLMLSTSAWNPFPMTLLTIIIYYLLTKINTKKPLPIRTSLILGITAAFGFHFSSAFAIFYPPIIIAYLLLLKIKISFKTMLAGIVGFSLPFLPQFLFELKHNFVQSKAIYSYFTANNEATIVTNQLGQVVNTTFDLFKSSLLPDQFSMTVVWILLAIVVAAVLIKKRSRLVNFKKEIILATLFVIFPLIGYQFLHFNIWYLFALAPIFTISVGRFLDHSLKPKYLAIFFALLILAATQNLIQYGNKYKPDHQHDRVFLPIKLETIQTIRNLADSKPYNVYTFAPHIYDYSYQYIYFWQAKQGENLPVEFSYSPGEKAYVQQKDELLAAFADQIQTGPAELVFLVIEKEKNTEDNWWYQQWKNNLPPYELIETKDLGDITIIAGKLI